MSVLQDLGAWLADPSHWSGPQGVPTRLLEHVGLSAAAVGIACAVAVPLALWLGHTGRGGSLAVNLANAGRAVPTVAVLVLLAVAAGAGWSYLRSQYYVGVDGEQVAIFRGVSGSVAGVRFAAVEEPTGLTTGRLDAISAAQVEKGIVAADRDDAERIVDRLVDRFPPCDEQPAASAPPRPAASAAPDGDAAADEAACPADRS